MRTWGGSLDIAMSFQQRFGDPCFFVPLLPVCGMDLFHTGSLFHLPQLPCPMPLLFVIPITQSLTTFGLKTLTLLTKINLFYLQINYLRYFIMVTESWIAQCL